MVTWVKVYNEFNLNILLTNSKHYRCDMKS